MGVFWSFYSLVRLSLTNDTCSGWHGCWGVCYTYAGWFGCGALKECKDLGIGDRKRIDRALEKGFKYLLDKQHADGSWGEDFKVSHHNST